MDVRIDILNVLRIFGVNISGDVQVIPILLFNFIIGYETRILRIRSNLLIKGSNDSVDIAFSQTILIAILNISTAGINHKDALSVCSTFFVNYEYTCSYSSAIKQVCRKANNALDPMFLYNSFSDGSLCVSTEEDSMRQNNRSLTI